MLLLEINNLSVSYGKAAVLHEVNLNVAGKELVAVIGPNGAGKTTLMRAVSGLCRGEGQIKFFGEQIDYLAPHEIVRRQIVLCPERRRLFPEMTVLRNLMMGAYLRRDRKGVDQDLHKIFDLLPALEHRQKNLAATLSGGEQQMLAVARALMSRPRLLMLDEPSFGLAPLVKQLIGDALQQIRKEGLAILLTEQDARLAFDLADRIYVLENGRITLEGYPKNLEDNKHVKEAYLGLA